MVDEVRVEGVVERVVFESVTTGFRVIKVAIAGRTESLAIVGTFPPVGVGSQIRAHGRWEHDRNHGQQLRAEGLTEVTPDTLVGLERYLGSGKFKGIGEKYAKRIVTLFGLDTLRILDENPERLTEVEGLGEKRRLRLVQAWTEGRETRDAMVFLQRHAVSPSLAARILRRYGTRAMNIIAHDPYRLAREVWGVGFKTADRIATDNGVSSDAPERLQAGILHTVEKQIISGHVFVPESELLDRGADLLELDRSDGHIRDGLNDGLERLVEEGALVAETHADTRLIFLAEMHAAEVRVAERLRALAAAKAPPLRGEREAMAGFERQAGVALAEEQRDAIGTAAQSPVMVITGGPGVGKTTVVRAVLAMFSTANLSVGLAAPTGRAAKRLGEATGQDALTLHRLLEFDPKGGRFKRNANNPIALEAIVVDEASMIDLLLADALTQAIAPGTRLIFVGDVDQLPSVGAGSVLRDVIASGVVACVRLRQIFRQAAESLIVVNAHRIHAGEPPRVPAANEPNADFYIIERRDADAARDTVVELVTQRIPKRFGFDPLRDIQVLTPMHRGPAGTLALNDALQAALNPTGHSVRRGSRLLRLGDKVMQVRNDYERAVWNGDIGLITHLSPQDGKVVVTYDAPSTSAGRNAPGRAVTYETSQLDELTLAYACSVHKAQGSEYPVIVLPFLTQHYMMLSRHLLYTAVTRGKKLVVLISDPRALSIALAEDRREERRSLLRSRLENHKVL